MNVLFLTLLSFDSLQERTIYTDLLREFVKNGHHVYVISPTERREGKKTQLINEDRAIILRLQIGNTQKTSIIEKGISTVMIGPTFKKTIKKYFSEVKFDLILYSTPPITFVSAIDYVKKRDGAKSYLLLKDIFPQNAVDIGIMGMTGLKGVLYRHFRRQEKKLYAVSDFIGCMSQANVDYVIKHNPEVRARNDREKRKTGRAIVEICPNCIEPVDRSISIEKRAEIRKKYNIPLNKMVFVYGGNLGKPQGIKFMLKCLHSQRKNDKAFFLIVGNGTEYKRVEHYIEKYKQKNVILHQWLPKDEYDKVIAACDVGMIFLDHRFTIPNFPSRLLSYMSAKLPVLAVTDTATDMGKVIVENGFGWWCESDDVNGFNRLLNDVISEIEELGDRGHKYLLEYYTVAVGYNVIMGTEKNE